MFAKHPEGECDDFDDSAGGDAQDPKAAIRQRYTADYSRWNEWVPQDPVTLAEVKAREGRREGKRECGREETSSSFIYLSLFLFSLFSLLYNIPFSFVGVGKIIQRFAFQM